MEELEKTRKEYVKQLKLSKIDLDGLDRHTRYNVEGVVNAAKQKLYDLRNKLWPMILEESVTVFVYEGINIDSALDDVIKHNTNVVELDFLELERRIVDSAFPQEKIRGYSLDGAAVGRVINAISNISFEIGEIYIPAIQIPATEYKNLVNRENTISFVKQLLTQKYPELKKLYLAKQINDFIDSRIEGNNKFFFFIVNSDKTAVNYSITGKLVVLDDPSESINNAKELQIAVSKKIHKKQLTS